MSPVQASEDGRGFHSWFFISTRGYGLTALVMLLQMTCADMWVASLSSVPNLYNGVIEDAF